MTVVTRDPDGCSVTAAGIDRQTRRHRQTVAAPVGEVRQRTPRGTRLHASAVRRLTKSSIFG